MPVTPFVDNRCSGGDLVVRVPKAVADALHSTLAETARRLEEGVDLDDDFRSVMSESCWYVARVFDFASHRRDSAIRGAQ